MGITSNQKAGQDAIEKGLLVRAPRPAVNVAPPTPPLSDWTPPDTTHNGPLPATYANPTAQYRNWYKGGVVPQTGVPPLPPAANAQIGSTSAGQAFFQTAPLQDALKVQGSAIAALQSTTFQGAWSNSVSYSQGASVEYVGEIYLSLTAGNFNNIPNISPLSWQLAAAVANYAGAWTAGVSYTIGETVSVSTSLYIALQNSLNQNPTTTSGSWQLLSNATTFFGNWSSSTQYSIGSEVLQNGAYWVATTANINQTPQAGSSYWVNVGTSAILLANYNNSTPYSIGMEVVGADGNCYSCIAATTGNAPPNATFWQLVGPATLDSVANGTIYIKGIQYSATQLVIQNANFEASTSLPVPGWTAASATLSYETSSPQSGNQSLKVTASSQFGAAQSVQKWAVAPGDTYLTAGYIKSDGTSVPYIQLAFADKNNVYTGGVQAAGSTSDTSWTYVTANGTVPANSVWAQLSLQNNAVSGSGVAEFDQIFAFRALTLSGSGGQVNDGPANFSATASTLTYRPLTNPLTATDAGSNATINIASFTMRTSSKGDVSENSGSITALSYSTVYYVYFDDGTLAGGAVTYVASTTKTTAINGTGRFFVGSIVTPAAGAPNTVGNNDGGVGASFGQAFNLFGGLATPTTSGGGSVTNPNNAIDGNPTTFAEITNGASAPSNNQLVASGFAPFQAVSGTVTLNVRSSGSNVAVSSTTTVKLEYSLDGGGTWTIILGPLAASSSWALQTSQVALALSQNTALVQVRATVNSIQSTANLGDIKLYEAYITVVQ